MEPIWEQNPHGQLAFNEDLEDNLALIRRIFKSKELIIEMLTLGANTQTGVAVCYLGNLASPELIREIRQRLNSFEIGGIINSSDLEQLITDNPRSFLPLIQNTGSTGKLIGGLLTGKAAILMDNCPRAILAPMTMHDLYQSPENCHSGFWSSPILYFFRILGSIIAVALPGFYIALTGVNPGLLPIHIALSVAASRTGEVLPFITGLLVMELFRGASLKLLRPAGQIVGITSGAALATVLMAAGFISNPTMVILIITIIASFSGAEYPIGLSWGILKFILILAAAFFGLYGFTIAGMMLLTHAALQNSFGTPYLAPWSLLDFRGIIDTVIRRPLRRYKRLKR
jgi:hypothetical protein